MHLFFFKLMVLGCRCPFFQSGRLGSRWRGPLFTIETQLRHHLPILRSNLSQQPALLHEVGSFCVGRSTTCASHCSSPCTSPLSACHKTLLTAISSTQLTAETRPCHLCYAGQLHFWSRSKMAMMGFCYSLVE